MSSTKSSGSDTKGEPSIFDLDDVDDDATPDASLVDADSQMEAIEASIEGTLKVLNDNEQAKRLTMQLIRQSMSMTIKQSARRLLIDEEQEEEEEEDSPEKDEAESEAEEIDSLLQKKVLRLDWMSLGRIENLDAFSHIQELYLQHNSIPRIENLDDHHELTFLALAGNKIQTVENIKHLHKLKFLDLSNNAIEDFDIREFPPSLVILRLAGNPFTRHMPAYMHLFFERLPNLTQIDQYRRAPSHALDGSPVGSPFSVSPLSVSPRTPFTELAMEVELSQKHHSARDAAPTGALASVEHDGAETEPSVWQFDSSDYDKQKKARLHTWRQQLRVLETRKGELESEIPMITRTTSASSLRSRRAQRIAKVREGTETAIADSIAHFQEREVQHLEWQEQQQHLAA